MPANEKAYNKLERLVVGLRKSNKESADSVVSHLQKINETFLQEYYLSINGVKVYPIEVEIYYKDDNYYGGFCDNMIYDSVDEQGKNYQRNNYHGLYIHPNGGYHGGFDIVLSDDDSYALSILIRSAYIGEIEKQSLYRGINRLKRALELHKIQNGRKVELIDNHRNDEVLHHKRITGKKYGNRNDYELNTFFGSEVENLASPSKFDMEKSQYDARVIYESIKTRINSKT
jgi:hypothetical protein